MQKSHSTCPCIKLHNRTRRFNPGFVYVAKDINQKCIEYLSELGILEQPSTTRIAEKLLNAFPNFCPKSINKNSVVLFSGTVSTLLSYRMIFSLHCERLYFLYGKNFLSRRTLFLMN